MSVPSKTPPTTEIRGAMVVSLGSGVMYMTATIRVIEEAKDAGHNQDDDQHPREQMRRRRQ